MDDDGTGGDLAGPEFLPNEVLSVLRLGGGAEAAEGVEALLVAEQSRAQYHQECDHGRGHLDGGPCDQGGDAVPDACAATAFGGLVHAPGPEDAPAQQEDQGGDEGERHQRHDGHAQSEVRSEAVKCRGDGHEQGKHGEHDGRGAGEDGLGGAAHGGLHRAGAVWLVEQGLAVAGGDDQRVVRAHPEQQHGHDRGGLGADRDDSGVRENRAESLRHAHSHAHGKKRHERHQGRAVDRQQDDQDEHDGGQQQDFVTAAEDLHGVGGDPGGAGHRDVGGPGPVGREGTHLVDRILEGLVRGLPSMGTMTS